MAHWAEIDETNTVVRVTVGDNNDPAGDEGYQWLVDNLGGTWLKTSYNTVEGKHKEGGIPFRGNYAGIGFTYHPEYDAFMRPKEFESWVVNTENYTWMPPIPKPDSGIWVWDEPTISWKEYEVG